MIWTAEPALPCDCDRIQPRRLGFRFPLSLQATACAALALSFLAPLSTRSCHPLFSPKTQTISPAVFQFCVSFAKTASWPRISSFHRLLRQCPALAYCHRHSPLYLPSVPVEGFASSVFLSGCSSSASRSWTASHPSHRRHEAAPASFSLHPLFHFHHCLLPLLHGEATVVLRLQHAAPGRKQR